MSKKRSINAPKAKSSNKISAQEATPNYDECPPIFSLERLQAGTYCLQELDQEGKANFADAIYRRKDKLWKEIKQMPKHGLGFEKIARVAIKAPIPKFITPDVEHFLAFRYHGLKPMVGYRKNDIFYVLWFDNCFSLYKH
ncbi:hypothetical protein K6Q96_14810 [Grimontia kaedaensis]|uniref:Uncharacterized protein n=1 Tax=Grimontia kaedaensis TaxID=2872157 RepID=A0ABY4WU38_9GAMM|nr:hypothetical protein [Grimontia kaedaensis]USH02119.1 hypothetical protein K6Q96_14810 [Grimontia kaedaensis]